MLLVELTINSTLFKLSQEGIALLIGGTELVVDENGNNITDESANNIYIEITRSDWWDGKIMSFSSPQLRVEQTYGGFAEMRFGSIILFPDLFEDDWPPPFNCPITVKYTTTTEEVAETLFVGNCHLASINRTGVAYDFYGTQYENSAMISSGESFNDDLDTVAAWFCHVDRLDLTLDTTYSRASSPTVVHTTSSDQIALKLFADIAAFFSHCFYIVGSTLYLIDMLLDNGSSTITEFDFMPSDYYTNAPLAQVVGQETEYTQESAYEYGQTKEIMEYCTNQAQVETALSNILAISNKSGCRLRMPFTGDIPLIGEKISWTDTSLGMDTDVYIRCRAVQYNFDSEEVIIEGEGVLT